MVVDPLDVEAMSAACDQLFTDIDARKERARKGLARAAPFTWEMTAEATIDA